MTPPTFRPYFGEFFLIGMIGQGGLGEVWQARHETHNQSVALKILRPDLPRTDAERCRVRAALEAAIALRHRHIIPTFEAGEFAGRQFYSMRLMDGGNLAEQMADGRWTVTRTNRRERQAAVASLLVAIGAAIHHAHQHGVLHRNLKPANIFWDADGCPAVGDFGLALVVREPDACTASNTLVGTPGYMAPEQAVEGAGPTTTAADIFGLGAILYHLLAGRPPFQGDEFVEVMRRTAEGLPPRPRELNPWIDRDLESICLRCLAREPSRRYGCAMELVEDLKQWSHSACRAGVSLKRAWNWIAARRAPRSGGGFGMS